MSDSDRDRDAVRYWLELAHGDLLAGQVLGSNDTVPPRLAAGSAHQAAEKALKALLASIGADPPRSHDLVTLAHLVATRLVLDVGDADLRALTDAHSEARYPAYRGLSYDSSEAAALVTIAVRIVGQIDGELGDQ